MGRADRRLERPAAVLRTVPGTRIHYGAGYSGNGVGPSWLGGQILASLVLGADDEWSRLPLARAAAAAASAGAGPLPRRRRRPPRDPGGRGGGRGRPPAVAARPRASPRSRACSACASGLAECRSTRSRLALGAAVLHALWNVLLARTRDPQAATAAAFCMAVAIWAPVAAVRWRVEAGAWKYIAAQRGLRARLRPPALAAYARAPLSVFYPIARGLAPVLVLAVAALALGAATSRRRRSASAPSAAGSCLSAAAGPTVRRRSSASRSRRRSPATR